MTTKRNILSMNSKNPCLNINQSILFRVGETHIKSELDFFRFYPNIKRKRRKSNKSNKGASDYWTLFLIRFWYLALTW